MAIVATDIMSMRDPMKASHMLMDFSLDWKGPITINSKRDTETALWCRVFGYLEDGTEHVDIRLGHITRRLPRWFTPMHKARVSYFLRKHADEFKQYLDTIRLKTPIKN